MPKQGKSDRYPGMFRQGTYPISLHKVVCEMCAHIRHQLSWAVIICHPLSGVVDIYRSIGVSLILVYLVYGNGVDKSTGTQC